MSKYYISDLHLGHYNAMSRFDHRPFKTLDEMDKKMPRLPVFRRFHR